VNENECENEGDERGLKCDDNRDAVPKVLNSTTHDVEGREEWIL
jgi:hypothetical protein